MQQEISLQINGRSYRKTVWGHHTLLSVLRDQFNLFSVREGCGVGMCGACTVLVDGNPISSCLTLAVMAEGKEIQTTEGLANQGELHPIQQAYIDAHGFQCSYCTPGLILATKALLETRPEASVEEIKDYLSGNLCRCGSYVKILDSVQLAQRRLRAADPT